MFSRSSTSSSNIAVVLKSDLQRAEAKLAKVAARVSPKTFRKRAPAGVALFFIALFSALAITMTASNTAFAADGDGGAANAGATGTGGSGQSGDTGADGAASSLAGGGGGGGAGVTIGGTGGDGGTASGGPIGGVGGAGGTGAGANGAVGGSITTFEGGGGGGGGGGTAGNGASGTIATNSTGGSGGGGGNGWGSSVVTWGSGGGGGGAGGYGAIAAGSLVNTFAVTAGAGGAGGAGGDGGQAGGNAGNGGAGGIGLQLTGAGVTLTNGGSIAGGNGGAGGIGGSGLNPSGTLYYGLGGNGGTGGNGVQLTGSGDTLINNGTISAGNGGAAGTDGQGQLSPADAPAALTGKPSAGAGGIAVTGSNLSIINSGTITGGTGLGLQYAIIFTGGVNSLTLLAGSSIAGVVSAQSGDTLTLGGTNNSSFNTSQIGLLTAGAQYSGFGLFTKTGTSAWTLTGTPNVSTPWTISGGSLLAGASTNVFGSTSLMTINSAGTLDLGGYNQQIGSLTGSGTVINSGVAANASLTTGADNTSTGFSGVIKDGSSTTGLTKTGTGTFTLSGTNTYSGPTTIGGGALALTGTGSIASSAVTDNGIFDISGLTNGGTSIAGLAGTGSVVLGANTLTLSNASGTFSGNIGGSGGLIVTAGTETLSSANGYGGGTTVSGGALQLSGAGTLGPTTSSATINGGRLDLGGTTQTLAALNLAGGTIQNGNLNAPIASSGGTVNNIGGTARLTVNSGTTFAAGANGFTGATIVDGGTLNVTGSITGSAVTVNNGGTLNVTGSIADPTINAGGMLTGTGSVGNTLVNAGGTFTPGSANSVNSWMTIEGNLAFASGAQYVVSLNPATSSFALVTGTATLGGATVNAIFGSGGYIAKQYTILIASGVSGTFSSLINTNLPANFRASLSYDQAHAYLDLALNYAAPAKPDFGGGSSLNQQTTGNVISNYFNTAGSIPAAFGGLTQAGLTQVSGETATASQQTTFTAMGQFMGVMTDPFINHNNPTNAVGSAMGYADQTNDGAVGAAVDAFAKMPVAAATFEQRWSVWAAGFGGSQSTSGNATAGSNNTTSSVAGTAVGADYLFSPTTGAGFALAGGGTGFSVANGGTGHSDLVQAGAYLRHNEGPFYLSAALADGWQQITTIRTVTVAGFDQLRAQFNANAWSGRVEGGYRFVSPWTFGIGVAPYAAGQFVTFELPAYAEQALAGTSNFALAYAAKTVTAARSELGFRTDKSWPVDDGAMTLRGRFAWAHDFDPDRSIAATFQALPGASFVVNGAAQAADSALTTASLEMKWRNGWSAAATFEGEFSAVTTSYAGRGAVRYQW